LSDLDKHILSFLSKEYSLRTFESDARNFEELMVDFVYTSAKIEGNTYDRVDTDGLLRMGITAGGKKYSDAKMLLNLRDAFDVVMKADSKTNLDEDYFCDLHKVLMKELLPEDQQGIVRSGPVTIGASKYRPLTDRLRLKTELKVLLKEADNYQDPFERSIYLHCNIAYLQFFRDGNKRSARMMQTAALVQSGVLPLFFRDTLISEYSRSIVNYYETGDYKPYTSFFIKNYSLVTAEMLGVDQDGLLKKATSTFTSKLDGNHL